MGELPRHIDLGDFMPEETEKFATASLWKEYIDGPVHRDQLMWLQCALAKCRNDLESDPEIDTIEKIAYLRGQCQAIRVLTDLPYAFLDSFDEPTPNEEPITENDEESSDE